jgi:hypothetical protein
MVLLLIDQHVDDLAEVERDGPILGRQTPDPGPPKPCLGCCGVLFRA